MILSLLFAMELGQRLFYDKRLSASCELSCADCHQQQYAFSSHDAPTLTNVGSRVALEKQMQRPLTTELHVNNEVLDRLKADYGPLTIDKITAAIAVFERQLVSNRSPYDRLAFHDDRSAMSDAAMRGMKIFAANCSSCHAGINFAGDGVPTLRNVALTAPYMHDGSIPTLRGVLDQHSRLKDDEKSDVIAFLESLTDLEFVKDPRLGPQ